MGAFLSGLLDDFQAQEVFRCFDKCSAGFFFYEIMDTGDVASIFCEVFTEQKVIRRPSNMIVLLLNKYLR